MTSDSGTFSVHWFCDLLREKLDFVEEHLTSSEDRLSEAVILTCCYLECLANNRYFRIATRPKKNFVTLLTEKSDHPEMALIDIQFLAANLHEYERLRMHEIMHHEAMSEPRKGKEREELQRRKRIFLEVLDHFPVHTEVAVLLQRPRVQERIAQVDPPNRMRRFFRYLLDRSTVASRIWEHRSGLIHEMPEPEVRIANDPDQRSFYDPRGRFQMNVPELVRLARGIIDEHEREGLQVGRYYWLEIREGKG